MATAPKPVAAVIELRYAFLDSALQNWQAIVNRNAAKLKAGSKVK